MESTNCENEVQPTETVCQECETATVDPAPSDTEYQECEAVPAEPVPKKPLFYREDTQDSYVWLVHKKLVAIIGIAIAACIALGVFGSFISSMLNRVNVTEYLVITTNGYNGYGTIDYYLDSEALLCDLYDLESEEKLYELPNEEFEQGRKVISALSNSISADADLTNLSNGDTRVFTFVNLKNVEKATGVKFMPKDELTYKVETLLEPNTFAVADLLDIGFIGYNGGGCVEVTPKTNGSYPFDLSWYYGTIYINDYYEFYLDTSGNEGTLSNGDTFTLRLHTTPETRGNLISEYGVDINTDEALECKVEGLLESQTVDIFSMLECTVTGLDGEGEVQMYWNEEEKSFGDIRVVVEDPWYSSFYIYSTVSIPSDGITFASGDYAYEEDYYVGNYYIAADKQYDIGSGDEISFRICSYDDGIVETDSLVSSGITFSSVEQTLSVDSTMLERYITSAKQINTNNVKALSEALQDGVTEYLQKNWSRIVHGNASFVCYDQVIKEAPVASEAYLACTNAKSNSYTMWILFTGTVTDSETTEPVPYYILVEISKPTISAGSTDTIYASDISFSYYDSVEDMQSARWFKQYMDNMTVITLG